jgi:subtilisin-like proprotein convertase family protein
VLRRVTLEALEPRTLLDATLPTPAVLSSPINITGDEGNDSTPSIAIDPVNPNKLAAAWVRNDPKLAPGITIFVETAVSSDGGATWSAPTVVPIISNPNTSGPVLPFAQVTDPSIAFDRNDHFYVLTDQRTADNSVGALVLDTYDYSSTTNPVPVALVSKTVYEWDGVDPALTPTMAVDSNVASFKDTNSINQTVTQTDPTAGTIYVAWASNDTASAAQAAAPTTFNPNRILISASSDGGNTFGGRTVLNTNGNIAPAKLVSPSLTISQGRPARAAGTLGPSDPGQTAIPGGHVTVGFDDIGTGATATVPFDLLQDNQTTGAVVDVFQGTGGTIGDALKGAGSNPDTPNITDFPVAVNVTDPRFLSVSDLTVTINATHPNLSELSVVLVPPVGSNLPSVTLFNNRTNSSGGTNTGLGITGANLGTTTSGIRLGTVFEDSANRLVTDSTATAPYTGFFRPEGGSLDFAYGSATATTGVGGINGTWILQVTDFRNSGTPPPAQSVQNFTLSFTSGLAAGTQTTIAETLVRGSATGTFPTAAPVSPQGIGPGLVLASDNTLGAYSQFQGRIYAAFVDRVRVVNNPADNTDIYLMASDDGGLTWNALTPTGPNAFGFIPTNFPGVYDEVLVNGDNALTDGFSASVPGLAGRPQFQPRMTVDPTTGTLVLSWFDARNDAASARVATYVTYSLDGGNTFSPQTYANVSQTVPDAITGAAVNLGPVPDNESPGNSNTEGTFGYGTHQGLAVYGGHVYLAWASNQVLGYSGGPDGKALLNVNVAVVGIPAGPRVIASTEGPVGDPGDTVNNTRTSDGTPQVSAFDVTFDRPVDPTTFTPNLVQVFFHDTTAANATGGLVPVTSVQPLDLGPLGATRFQVSFAPRSAVGTYSYSISPGISDRIRTSATSIVPAGAPLPAFNSSDGPIPLPPFNSSTNTPGVINSAITINDPNFANQLVSSLTVTLNIASTNDNDLILTLIAPDGTPIALYNGPQSGGFGPPPSQNGFSNTTFDDSAFRSINGRGARPPFTGSFRPAQPLSLLDGKSINGTWTLQIQNSGRRSTTTYDNWSLDITPGTAVTTSNHGNLMDQNANGTAGETAADVYSIPTPTGGTPFVAPFDQTTLPLIVPGPHVISSNVPGNPATSNNLVLNSAVSAIDVTFDRDMDPNTFKPAQILRVVGPAGAVPGPYTVTPNPLGTDPNPSFPRTYRIGFTAQTVSGSYTITLSSGIRSASGDPLDTNENAGVNLLFGTAPLGTAIPSTFSNTTVTPLASGSTVSSSLTIPTGFLVQGLTVSLDITYANDPDLEVFLTAPDGTSIELIKNAGTAGSGNFTGTILDDAASVSVQNATAPFTGRFQPQQPLSTFNGKNALGTWTLSITDDATTGLAGTLNSWSLAVQPPSTNTYLAQINRSLTIPTPSGAITQPLNSTINVPDSFPVAGVSVQLNITDANDPDLEAYLIAPDGTTVELFKNVGATGTKANFTNTIFSDNATTLIQAGGAPFFGSFQPEQAGGFLQALVSGHIGGAINSNGTWTLRIIDDKSDGIVGTLSSWSLILTKSVPIDGLGEPVADQATIGFQIDTTAATAAQSSTSWTAVGPTSISDGTSLNGYAGRVSSLAADPSDPSGNTVYAAGASGGVWKTTDFLTTDPNGPNWIPLTDFGPTSGLNIGSIAVFGRNSDPKQSIIIAATGEANATYGIGGNTMQGVGFLRSMDGGQTWTLLDSTNNNFPYALQDHLFAQTNPSLGTVAGVTTAYKVVVDPHPTPSGSVIVYAALGGLNGGLWRSVDTGQTWQRLSDPNVQGTIATDVVLNLNSATVNAFSNPTGNVNTIYVAFQGAGTQVYTSPNRGQTLTPMTGSNFDAFIQMFDVVQNGQPKQVPLASSPNPLGGGRVTLAVPSPVPSTVPNADVENKIYQNWLYAAVADPAGGLAGLFVTKDNGATWTRIQIPVYPLDPNFPLTTAVPTNDDARPDYNVISNAAFPQGNYTISLAVDPLNPSVVYFGGTSDGQTSGLIRVDTTGLFDSHAFVAFDNNLSDGGKLEINTAGRIQVTNYMAKGLPIEFTTFQEYLNLIQNPSQPFSGNGSTVLVDNITNFTNSGAGVHWTPFDQLLNANATDIAPSTNVHQIVTVVDPLTGQTRLIVGDDQGVFTGVDAGDGTLNTGIGSSVPVVTYSRNGNLQIAQLYSGAAVPNTAAATATGAQFYGNGLSVGGEGSDPQILTDGNIQAVGTTSNTLPVSLLPLAGDHQGTGIATDQQGQGLVYQYVWPGYSGSSTNFFQVSVNGGPFIVETNGLIQAPNDPQWPIAIPLYPGNVVPGKFTVNPVDGNEVVMSSNAGRIFELGNNGATWQVIGDPNFLDGSYAPALTFGAPDPNSPDGVGALNNFVYAGTVNGNIFVTQTGGGGGTTGGRGGGGGGGGGGGVTNGNQWTNIGGVAHGLDGSGVMQIITNPTRGSHEAYAVTLDGVYHISDSLATSATTTTMWTNITGNLFTILNSAFGNSSEQTTKIQYLTGIQADWNYVIPNASGGGTHPVLYVSANSGVYRSLDNGVTWAPFPATNDSTLPGSGGQQNGGFLPNAQVSQLSLVQGANDPTTGRAAPQPGDPNVLLATTFGRGQFAIRLAPVVFPGTVQLDTKLPAPNGSISGKDAQGNPIVKVAQPVIDGLSEQTAFGNTVYISLVDMTDPSNPRIIGGYDPSNPSTAIAANETNASGNFSVQVNPAAFATSGVKTIGVYATDLSGTSGDMQEITIDLQTTSLGLPQPPTTPTLTLNPFDDSSNTAHLPGQGLNVTNFTTVHLIGTTSPGATVALFPVINGITGTTSVGTTTAGSNGNFSIPVIPVNPATLLPDGTYTYVVQATNSFGTTKSAAFSFTIKTKGPTGVQTLGLNPRDDTGVKGDGTTANTRPRLVGVADPGVFVDILDASNNVLVTTSSDASGNYSVQLPGNLSNGTITLFARARDLANNIGSVTAQFVLTIATTAGAPAAPVLQAGSDTGVIGDNITSVRNPQFNVSGVPAGATVSLFRDGVVVGIVANVAGGTVAIGDPGLLLDGQHTYTASLVDSAGNVSPASAPLTISIVSVKGDYVAAGFAQLAVFNRVNPGVLAILIAGGVTPPGGANAFGSGALDIPFQGDLDGDGKTDLILYRPSTSQWFVQESSGGFVQYSFGAPGDLPAVGDFDGVGHDELAVYRPSTSQWFVAGHPNVFATFGGPGDLPVALRNYYGTGQDVLAVFRPTTGTWYVAGQASGISFGGPGDVPVPLFNYSGNGRDTLAVFRPSTSQWFVAGLGSGISFGGAGDVPVSADFDGVGHDEIGVYRPSTGQWFVGGHASAIATFGSSTDIPLEAPYLYRVVGLSTKGIPASSLYAYDFSASAAALSTGSSSSSGSAVTAPSTSSTSTTTTSSPSTPVVSTTPQGKRPKQGVKHPKNHLHDIALASLQGSYRQARK